MRLDKGDISDRLLLPIVRSVRFVREEIGDRLDILLQARSR